MAPILRNLKMLRETKAMTERQLAKRSSVPSASIVRLEAGGSAHFSTITRLAEALEVEPAQLVGE